MLNLPASFHIPHLRASVEHLQAWFVALQFEVQEVAHGFFLFRLLTLQTQKMHLKQTACFIAKEVWNVDSKCKASKCPDGYASWSWCPNWLISMSCRGGNDCATVLPCWIPSFLKPGYRFVHWELRGSTIAAWQVFSLITIFQSGEWLSLQVLIQDERGKNRQPSQSRLRIQCSKCLERVSQHNYPCSS